MSQPIEVVVDVIDVTVGVVVFMVLVDPRNLPLKSGPGQPVGYQSPKRTMIASSTSHLLASMQCQHFLTEKVSQLSREPTS